MVDIPYFWILADISNDFMTICNTPFYVYLQLKSYHIESLSGVPQNSSTYTTSVQADQELDRLVGRL